MGFAYRTDDNQELDEASFWQYVILRVREIYAAKGLNGVYALYDVEYWGDCDIPDRTLKQIIDNQLNRIRNEP